MVICKNFEPYEVETISTTRSVLRLEFRRAAIRSPLLLREPELIFVTPARVPGWTIVSQNALKFQLFPDCVRIAEAVEL